MAEAGRMCGAEFYKKVVVPRSEWCYNKTRGERIPATNQMDDLRRKPSNECVCFQRHRVCEEKIRQ